MLIVERIVDRDCHVSESNRAVIRHVASKIRGGVPGFLKLPRETRREVMQAAIARHALNGGLYDAVMRGSR